MVQTIHAEIASLLCRSEKAGEKNDETNRENVQTREYEA